MGVQVHTHIWIFMYDIEKSGSTQPEAKVPTVEHSSVSAEGKAGRGSVLENGYSRIGQRTCCGVSR